MKKQASLNLLITDNTAEKKALDGHLMLVATESGFKSIDSTGSEAEIGGGSVDESRLLPDAAVENELAIKRIDATGIDSNTYLMLHFDEAEGAPVDVSQSSLVVDPKSTTVNTSGKFSNARDLNNSYLELTNAAFATGSGDFTYDGWFYSTQQNKRRALFGVNLALYCAVWEDNTVGVGISEDNSSWTWNHLDSDRSEATIPASTWYHLAVVKHGTTVTTYLNGTSILSFEIGSVTDVVGTGPFRIGYPLGGMSDSTDRVDEFRFSNVARWTSDFVPPTAPYSSSPAYWEGISLEELASEMPVIQKPENAENGDMLIFDATATIGGGNDENTKALLHFDSSITYTYLIK